MQDLFREIPDADVLLSLEPEELGAKVLFLIRKRDGSGQFSPFNYINELSFNMSAAFRYPDNKTKDVIVAVSEAFAWLDAQGLTIPVHQSMGYRVLSRRSQRFEVEEDLSAFSTVRRFPKELIHPRIADKTWMAFMRGDFGAAAFEAMKAVEISVRAAVAPDLNDKTGVKLMRGAFAPEGGPLTDPFAEGGERSGCMELFTGAMGYLRNPHAHREVELEEPSATIEIIMLASHLLRIVDERQRMLRERKAVSGDVEGGKAAGTPSDGSE